MKGGTYFILRS